MHTNGPIHFAPLAKQAAEGKMCLECLVIQFGHARKHLYRPVRLFIQDIVQALHVV